MKAQTKIILSLIVIIFACDSYDPSKMPALEDYGNDQLKAINILTQKYPRTSTNYYNKARILWEMGKRKESLSSIAKAVEMNETRGEYHLFLAQSFLENDSIKAAFNSAKKAESLGLDSLTLQVLLADLYTKERQYPEAMTNINKALAKEPDYATFHLKKGQVALALKDQQTAESSLLKTLELNPEEVNASKALADIYIQRNDHQKALIYIDQNLNKNPKDADFLYKKGYALKETGNRAQAANMFRAVIKEDQQYAAAYSQMGMIWLRLGRTDSARYYARSARAIDNQDKEALLTLARVADRKKGYYVALEHYNQILAMDSTYVPAVEEKKKLMGKIKWLQYLAKQKAGE